VKRKDEEIAAMIQHCYTEYALIEQPRIGLFRTRDLLLPKLISGEVEAESTGRLRI
jgi:hypothetical protein